jgi:hypothetical protein
METDYVRIWVENDVLYITYLKEQIDLPYAKNVVETRLKVSGGKSYPVMVDLNKVKGVCKEARAFLAGKEASDLISSSALLGTGELIRMLVNFYLFINKPKVPIRLFNNQSAALEWLQKN